MAFQLAEYFIAILENLDQLWDVEEFYMRVCNLRDLILENDSTYKELYFVACFIQGLKQDIGEFVMQCSPATLDSAYASALQRELEIRTTTHALEAVSGDMISVTDNIGDFELDTALQTDILLSVPDSTQCDLSCDTESKISITEHVVPLEVTAFATVLEVGVIDVSPRVYYEQEWSYFGGLGSIVVMLQNRDVAVATMHCNVCQRVPEDNNSSSVSTGVFYSLLTPFGGNHFVHDVLSLKVCSLFSPLVMSYLQNVKVSILFSYVDVYFCWLIAWKLYQFLLLLMEVELATSLLVLISFESMKNQTPRILPLVHEAVVEIRRSIGAHDLCIDGMDLWLKSAAQGTLLMSAFVMWSYCPHPGSAIFVAQYFRGSPSVDLVYPATSQVVTAAWGCSLLAIGNVTPHNMIITDDKTANKGYLFPDSDYFCCGLGHCYIFYVEESNAGTVSSFTTMEITRCFDPGILYFMVLADNICIVQSYCEQYRILSGGLLKGECWQNSLSGLAISVTSISHIYAEAITHCFLHATDQRGQWHYISISFLDRVAVPVTFFLWHIAWGAYIGKLHPRHGSKLGGAEHSSVVSIISGVVSQDKFSFLGCFTGKPMWLIRALRISAANTIQDKGGTLVEVVISPLFVNASSEDSSATVKNEVPIIQSQCCDT